MSATFPVVDCSTGQSFSLARHLFLLSQPSGSLPVQLKIVECPASPGDPAAIAAIYTLHTSLLLALRVSAGTTGPMVCINTVARPEADPDIEAVIGGADPDARAAFWLFEDRSELEFFLGTDDQRVDCLSTSAGYAAHPLLMRFALSRVDIALGYESATGTLEVYYRLPVGVSGGYTRLMERSTL